MSFRIGHFPKFSFLVINLVFLVFGFSSDAFAQIDLRKFRKDVSQSEVILLPILEKAVYRVEVLVNGVPTLVEPSFTDLFRFWLWYQVAVFEYDEDKEESIFGGESLGDLSIKKLNRGFRYKLRLQEKMNHHLNVIWTLCKIYHEQITENPFISDEQRDLYFRTLRKLLYFKGERGYQRSSDFSDWSNHIYWSIWAQESGREARDRLVLQRFDELDRKLTEIRKCFFGYPLGKVKFRFMRLSR